MQNNDTISTTKRKMIVPHTEIYTEVPTELRSTSDLFDKLILIKPEVHRPHDNIQRTHARAHAHTQRGVTHSVNNLFKITLQ